MPRGRPRVIDEGDFCMGMQAAAAKLGVPLSWIKTAKESGLQAFSSNSRVNLPLVREWLDQNREKLETVSKSLPLKEQKLVEEIRKLKLANDIKDETVVNVAWLVKQISLLGADLNSIESNILKEYPTRMAGVGTDAGGQRELLRTALYELRKKWAEFADRLDRKTTSEEK